MFPIQIKKVSLLEQEFSNQSVANTYMPKVNFGQQAKLSRLSLTNQLAENSEKQKPKHHQSTIVTAQLSNEQQRAAFLLDYSGVSKISRADFSVQWGAKPPGNSPFDWNFPC